MAQYLDPKNDLTFKRVFGEHKHLCISLINSLLPLEKPVINIEYQTGELIPELPGTMRNTIVDVRCTDEDHRQFIVEMQMYWTESFKSRVLLNASKAYIKQLDVNKEYRLLQPVYMLNFVNEIFEKSDEMKDVYQHHYKIVNIADTEKRIEGMEFHFVELPKFTPQNRAEKKLHDLWLLFLTQVKEDSDDIPPELLEHEYTREAVGYMEKAAYTKEQLLTYDRYKDAIMTELSVRGDAWEKGRAESKAEVVIKAVKKGMAIEDITDLTGLSKQQIEEIIKKSYGTIP